MITFSKKGNSVKLQVELPMPWGTFRSFLFYWEAGSEWGAELLLSAMQKAFTAAVIRTRENAYNQGFKDAKAKRARRTAFQGYLD